MNDKGTTTVLPESLLELLPRPPPPNSPREDAEILIEVTQRLLRSLPVTTESSFSTQQLRLLKQRLSEPGTGKDLTDKLVLSFKNELGAKGDLITAIAQRILKGRSSHDTAEGLNAELQVRRKLSTLRLEDLRRHAQSVGIDQQTVMEILGAGQLRRDYGAAADRRDVAHLVTCRHSFFVDLGLERLYGTRLQLNKKQTGQSEDTTAEYSNNHEDDEDVHLLRQLDHFDSCWSAWCAKIAQVQHRHGSDLWRKLREQLELVGETAHFLYSDFSDGIDVRRAYAKPTAVQESIEYHDIEKVQRAEDYADSLCCFVHPNRTFRTCWDIGIVCLLLYIAVLIPIRIGFFVEVKPGEAGFAVDVVTDVFFAADIVMNFRTGLISQTGVLISDGATLAYHYLKGWFVVDLLSCLPVSYFILLTESEGSGGSASSSTKTIKILRLLRYAI